MGRHYGKAICGGTGDRIYQPDHDVRVRALLCDAGISPDSRGALVSADGRLFGAGFCL